MIRACSALERRPHAPNMPSSQLPTSPDPLELSTPSCGPGASPPPPGCARVVLGPHRTSTRAGTNSTSVARLCMVPRCSGKRGRAHTRLRGRQQAGAAAESGARPPTLAPRGSIGACSGAAAGRHRAHAGLREGPALHLTRTPANLLFARPGAPASCFQACVTVIGPAPGPRSLSPAAHRHAAPAAPSQGAGAGPPPAPPRVLTFMPRGKIISF